MEIREAPLDLAGPPVGAARYSPLAVPLEPAGRVATQAWSLRRPGCVGEMFHDLVADTISK